VVELWVVAMVTILLIRARTVDVVDHVWCVNSVEFACPGEAGEGFPPLVQRGDGLFERRGDIGGGALCVELGHDEAEARADRVDRVLPGVSQGPGRDLQARRQRQRAAAVLLKYIVIRVPQKRNIVS
jgi:hypothetical protein